MKLTRSVGYLLFGGSHKHCQSLVHLGHMLCLYMKRAKEVVQVPEISEPVWWTHRDTGGWRDKRRRCKLTHRQNDTCTSWNPRRLYRPVASAHHIYYIRCGNPRRRMRNCRLEWQMTPARCQRDQRHQMLSAAATGDTCGGVTSTKGRTTPRNRTRLDATRRLMNGGCKHSAEHLPNEKREMMSSFLVYAENEVASFINSSEPSCHVTRSLGRDNRRQVAASPKIPVRNSDVNYFRCFS